MSTETKPKYRSADWFGKADKDGFIHRSWMRNQGLPGDVFDGRPVIGICNTWSELTPCNAHFRELAEHVKRGVWEAGGFPLEFPVMSLGETIMRPTAMLFRNLASMDVEESIRANPIDGVVLLCGCDKTTPSLVMGAASCDIPAIVVSGGPMLNGKFRGADIGSGTDVWRFSEEVKAGTHEPARVHGGRVLHVALAGPLHDHGHGVDHGVHGRGAGLSLPDNAAIPAVDSRRSVPAHLAGRRIVEMVRGGPAAFADPDARGFRERHPRERRGRRIDQRRDSSAGHRRTRRRAARRWTTGIAWATTAPRWSTSCRPGSI